MLQSFLHMPDKLFIAVVIYFFFPLNFHSAKLKRDVQASDFIHSAKWIYSFTCSFLFLHFLSVELFLEKGAHCILGIWCSYLQKQAKRSMAPGQKPMQGISTSHYTGDYKGFTWQASSEKAALSTPDLVHSQCITVFKRSCSQGLRPFWLVMLFCTFAFIAQVPSINIELCLIAFFLVLTPPP